MWLRYVVIQDGGCVLHQPWSSMTSICSMCTMTSVWCRPSLHWRNWEPFPRVHVPLRSLLYCLQSHVRVGRPVECHSCSFFWYARSWLHSPESQRGYTTHQSVHQVVGWIVAQASLAIQQLLLTKPQSGPLTSLGWTGPISCSSAKDSLYPLTPEYLLLVIIVYLGILILNQSSKHIDRKWSEIKLWKTFYALNLKSLNHNRTKHL